MSSFFFTHDTKVFFTKYKKVLAFLRVSRYTFPVMNKLLQFSASTVSDLSFVSIADRVDDNWADWEVEFTANEKSYVGFLGACPFHPKHLHDDDIIEAEELA